MRWTTTLVMVVALGTGWAGPAAASIDPALKCRAAKHKAAGKYASAVLGCASKAAKTDTVIDAGCVAKAAVTMNETFAKADTGAGTACNGDAGPSRGVLDDLQSGLSSAIPGGGDSATCASRKRKAAGKYAAALLKAGGKNVASPNAAKYADTIEKAEAKFSSSWTKAGDCASQDDVSARAAVEDVVDPLSTCIASADPCTQVEIDVAAGGTGTSDPADVGASPSHPITTSIVTPVAGVIRIVESESFDPPPAGYEVLGVQVQIVAPAASAAAPLVFTFEIDASLLPPDTSTVKFTRNGVVVEECTGTPGTASPDPCESARQILGDGDLSITVLTSQASSWAVVNALPGTPCTMTGTWSLYGNPSVQFHMVEQPGGMIRYVQNAADAELWPDTTPVNGIGDTFVRTDLDLNLDGMTGTVDATCDNINFPAISGSNPTLVRIADTACGDGVLDAAAGEQCDDGNWDNLDGCNIYVCDTADSPGSTSYVLNCRVCVSAPATCGDGNPDAGEECDDGNLYAGDSCRPDCTLPCGNGVLDPVFGSAFGSETCDDGNNVSGDCCSATCQFEELPVCGDGCLIQFAEDCDDGNVADGDGCSSTCQVE